MSYLLRLSVGILAATACILLLSAFGARLPDQPICLTITAGRDAYILDVRRGLIELDARYPRPSFIPYLNHDYVLAAYPYPEDSRRVRLMLENREGSEKILLDEEIYLPGSGWWGNRTSWWHDQQRLAYLWQDGNEQEHLTVFNLVDRSKRTAPLTQFDPATDDIWLAGWSADGNYLSLHEQDMRNGAAVHILSIETLEPVVLDPDLPKLLNGAWSPKGDIYAAITQQNSQRLLLIISPENPESIVRTSIPADVARNIVWSPDGERLTLARQRLITRNNVWMHQWVFEIFNADGTLLQQDIVGKSVPQPPPGTTITTTANYIPGFWSLDGEQWIFLQEQADGDLADLMAFNTTSGDIEPIETDLVSDPALGMFFPNWEYVSSVEQNGIPPDNRQLILPLWRDEAITLEYVNFERNQRYTLVEGASEILRSSFIGYFLALVQLSDNHFVVTWSDSSGEAHLRVVRSDDGSIVTDLGDMQTVLHTQELGDGWYGFTSQRDDEYNIELVHVQTGEHRPLLTGLEEDNPWMGVLSPDQQLLAIFTANADQLYGSGGRIFIVALDSGDVKAVGENAHLYPIWSPDSSMIAYPYEETRTKRGIYVVNTEGEIIQQTRLPGDWSTQSTISQWSRCEANPPRNL